MSPHRLLPSANLPTAVSRPRLRRAVLDRAVLDRAIRLLLACACLSMVTGRVFAATAAEGAVAEQESEQPADVQPAAVQPDAAEPDTMSEDDESDAEEEGPRWDAREATDVSGAEDLTPARWLPAEATSAGVVSGSGEFPWYDPAAARIRPTPPAGEPERPQPSDWEWISGSDNSTSRSWDWLADVLQWIAWAVLLLVFAVLLYLPLRRLLYPPPADSPLNATPETRPRSEIDSIEQLPFQVPVAQSDLLGEARRCYEAGRYRDAMIYLYSYQLVQLDQHHKIHLSKGKTNRQYLHELAPHARLRELLTHSVRLFEDAFFGHYELERERFEAAWSHLDEFQGLARRVTG